MIPLQTFTCENERYTIYETHFQPCLVIVKESLFCDVWELCDSLSIPTSTWAVIQSVLGLKSSTQDDENKVENKEIMDRDDLPQSVKRKLFSYDCENVPLSENQLGYFGDVQTLEDYWQIQRPSSSAVTPPPAPKKLKRSREEEQDRFSSQDLFKFDTDSFNCKN